LTYTFAGDINLNMNYLRAIRGLILGLTFLFAGGLFTNLVLAQESKQAKTDWVQVREAFDAYFFSPTEENAMRVLSALPDKIDDETTNYEALNSAIIGIWDDHISELSALIKKGDRLALRIAYNYARFTDGIYSEAMCNIIGDSVVVMPVIFLEETGLFKKNYPRSNVANDEGLSQILFYFIALYAFRPDVISKEVRARIKALESVEREDLLEFRDDCMRRLREGLKTLRHQPQARPVAQDRNLP